MRKDWCGGLARLFGLGWWFAPLVCSVAFGQDVQPPTAPTNPTATAASSTAIIVSWNASTDNVGVASYEVQLCQGSGCNSSFTMYGSSGTSRAISGLTAATTYGYRVRAKDAVPNYSAYTSIVYVTTQAAPDTQAPTAPTNFNAVASSSTGAVLTWNAATDNVAVTGYQVDRCQGSGCNSSFTTFNISPSTGWANTGLTAGTTYGYRVRARDAVPNYSAYTSIVYVTTPSGGDTQAPTVPTGLTATASSSTHVNVLWSAATDNVAVTGYQLERCQGAGCTSSFTQLNITSTTYADPGRSPSTTYGYRVRARDAAANYSAFTSVIYVTTPTAGGGPTQNNSVTYGHDARGRLTSAIFADGTAVNYEYDANGNRTGATVVPAADTSAPSVPTTLLASAVSQSQINLSWNASTDAVGVTGYRLERCVGSGCTNFSQIATPSATSYSNTGLSQNTTYTYRVRATDGAGNLSGFSSTAAATTPATTAPTAPGTLTFSAITMTSATASWTAATDDVGVTGYQYRLNAGNWQTLSNVLSVNLTSLSPATNYTFEVRARDAAGSWGSVAAGVFATTDTAAPSAPGTPSFSGVTTSAATVGWTASADNVGVVGYDYRLNSAGWQSLANVLSVSLSGLSSATTYTFTLRARDAAGNLSSTTSNSFTTDDASAPTTPTGLSASAPNSSTVNLSWTASTDNVGVSGYRIRRGGEPIGTSTTTSYTDSTVSGSTLYTYTVSAYDAAGNTSPQSSAVTLTTPDTFAPSTPTGLSAVAAHALQVNLTWTPSSDAGGSGLGGYRVYRNGTLITSVSSAGYNDTTVSASTSYSYTVLAYDNANNLSGHSNTASVTTPAYVPATPVLSVQPGANISLFSVHWTVPSGPLSYYELETSANWVPPGVTTHYPPETSRGYSGGEAYWEIRIRACNASNQCSAWSNTVSWQTCPVTGCP